MFSKPQSIVTNLMNLFYCLPLYPNSFFTTYQVAFGTVDPVCNSRTFWVVDFVVMLFFFLDISVKFNLAYVSAIDGVTITNRNKIVNQYLRGWFLADFLSTFPWDYLGLGSSPRLIRLLRLAKLMRLVRASRLIVQVMKESNFKMSTWSFYKTTLLVILISHWVSCVWMLLGQIDEEKGWMTQFICREDDACWEQDEVIAILNRTGALDGVDGMGGAMGGELGGRMLKQRDGGGKTAVLLTDKSWYFLCLEFTLAALNVWPYDGVPQPVSKLEQWVAVLTIFMAATIYAYLAGVVVELVSRQGERTREVDGIFDALVEYMVRVQVW
jgi:hypothetical protein